jgi:hypothetical protein
LQLLSPVAPLTAHAIHLPSLKMHEIYNVPHHCCACTPTPAFPPLQPCWCSCPLRPSSLPPPLRRPP